MKKSVASPDSEQIADAFQRKDMVIYTDPSEFKRYLFSQSMNNTSLLLMRSGDYGGLDFEEVKGLL